MTALRLPWFAVLLHAFAAAAPPPNDSFGSRATLATGTAATATTAEATVEAGEVRPFWLEENRYRRSVWWKWTASTSGWHQVTTSGSAADTVLSVSTGNTIGALSLLQANDNDLRANNSLTSEYLVGAALPCARVLFEAVAGTEYQLAVATGDIDAGTVRVKVDPFAPPSPRLTAFTVTPAIVDVAAPSPRATAVFSLTSHTPFLRGTLYVYNRANGYQSRVAGFSPTNRTSGDELNGTYSVVVNPQLRSPAGTADVQLILEAEGDSEISSYGARGHTPMPPGATASFPMVNSGTPDTAPPVIVSCDIAPTSHDITSGTKSSTATVRVTDDLSGLKMLLLSFIDNTGREFYRAAQSFRTSGTLTDGVYTLGLDFPYFWRVGSYSVRAWAEDLAGNVGTPIGPGMAGWPGPFTGTVEIARTNTVTMTGLTVSPAVVDVSHGPQTVTIEADVTPPAGVQLLSATFTLWPAMVGEPYFTNYAPEISVSSANSDVVKTATGWKATLTVPQGYPPGLAPLGIQCVAGNAATYFGSRFNVPFPSGPTGITVINDTNPDIRPPRAEYLNVSPDPMVRTGCPGDTARGTVRLTDDSSGLPDAGFVSIGLRTSNFSVTGWHTAVGTADRFSGTDRDGLYTFPLLAETSLHGTLSAGDYVLETVMSDKVGRKATVNRTRNFKLSTAPAAWMTWIDGHFSGAGSSCQLTQFWGPYADPDGDGAGNLLEGYFNTDPTSRAMPLSLLTPTYLAGSGEISATWTEPATTNGITVMPQWSPDLTTWLGSGESVRGTAARTLTLESIGAGPGGVLRRLRMSGGSGSGAWLRLLPVPAP